MDFIPITEAKGIPDLIEQFNTRLGDIYDTAFEAKNIGITIPAEKVDGDHAIRMTVQEALVPLFGTSPAVIDADDTMSGVKWTDLTDGGDTVLHKHDIYGELASTETVTGLWTFSDILTASSFIDGAALIRATGGGGFAAGAGTYIGYNAAGPYGFLGVYDWDGTAYRELRIIGTPISFHPNNAGEEVQIADGVTYIRGGLDCYGYVQVQNGATVGPSGTAGWQFITAPSQINLVSAGALMLGDAQKIFFEFSGTTQGTESIYSAADNRLDVLAGTNFDINIGGAEVSTFDAGGLNLATGTGIDINSAPFIQYINTSTIVMGIGAAAGGADDESLIFGDNAGAALGAGNDRMTIFGHNAAVAWTSNRSLIGGYGAANGGTGGTLDVIIGNSAVGVGSFTGTRDTVVGAQCARDLTTSNDSCYYGYRSGDSVTTGDEEAIFGASAGISLTTEDKNSYFGKSAAEGATSHSGACFGYKAGFTGPDDRSVCLGPYAGYYETAADTLFIDNRTRTNEADGRLKGLIVGTFAAATADQSVTINGDLNVRESIDLLVATTSTAGQITQAGTRILHTYGTDNLFVGSGAGNFTTSGIGQNVGIGDGALLAISTGYQNMALGQIALTACSGGLRNTAVGRAALFRLTSGDDNVGIGAAAAPNVTLGNKHTVIGASALGSATTVSEDVAIGWRALYQTTGGTNTAVGTAALYASAAFTGNVALGYYAGHYETGNNKLFIDNAARASEADGRVKALLTGVFAAAVADQSVTVNGLLSSRYGASFGDVVTNFMQVTAGGLTTWHGTAGVPHAETWVLGNAVATAIAGAGTFAQFVGFANDGNALDAVPDHTNDHITITTAGKYLVVASFHVESIGAGAADIVSIEIRKNNGTVSFNNLHAHRKLAGGGGDVGSVSISGIADLAATDTVEVWLTNDDNATDILVADANLSVVQIGGT